jgi:diaminohydroxyphosphoribosylaminopyrimidine deaminase/5-amino-6-(5-phosphoribosylamino)uracil reductase
LRKIYDAILTTSSTVIADNPAMLHSTKVILDRNLRTDFENAEIYKNGTCYVYYDENIEPIRLESAILIVKNKTNIKLCPTKVIGNKIDLTALFNHLYENNIMSVFIEAGGNFCGSALPYADKIYQFIAPKILGDNSGLSCFNIQNATNISDSFEFEFKDIKKCEPDILLIYSRKV